MAMYWRLSNELRLILFVLWVCLCCCSTKLTPGHITCSFVVLGALLDLFHIYDRLIKIFHAGAMLPITSFGHSLMHGAMAMTKEYGVFGLAMGMFDLTAAGISSAILFAFIIALFFKPKS